MLLNIRENKLLFTLEKNASFRFLQCISTINTLTWYCVSSGKKPIWATRLEKEQEKKTYALLILPKKRQKMLSTNIFAQIWLIFQNRQHNPFLDGTVWWSVVPKYAIRSNKVSFIPMKSNDFSLIKTWKKKKNL